MDKIDRTKTGPQEGIPGVVDCTKERFCNDSDSDMDSIRKLVLYSFVFLWGGWLRVCCTGDVFN